MCKLLNGNNVTYLHTDDSTSILHCQIVYQTLHEQDITSYGNSHLVICILFCFIPLVFLLTSCRE